MVQKKTTNKIYSIINKGKNLNVTHLVDDVYTFEGEIEVSDGHHTMEELYEHRHRLYLALVKIYDNYITPLGREVKCWKSRIHDDGSSYEGWFLLGMTVTKRPSSFLVTEPVETFDIGYHLPDKYWHLANVIELEKAPPYDGYTSQDVMERLLRL